MAIKVWEESKIELEDVYLRLIDGKDGYIRIVACDKEGSIVDSGNLLRINKETGTIRRSALINPNLGFDLTLQGRIKLEGEEY